MSPNPTAQVNVQASSVLGVLADYSRRFPYRGSAYVRETSDIGNYLVPEPHSLIRFLPMKDSWFVFELIGFEGDEFVYAATRSLCRRAPTAAEAQAFAAIRKSSRKIEFLASLDARNKREKSGVRIIDARLSRKLWQLHQAAEKRKYRRIAKLAHSLFRARARRELNKASRDAILQNHLFGCFDRIERGAAR
jgi:hypothetical protein